MGANRDKPDRWKQDIARSVDMYNDWFLRFAPAAYQETRIRATSEVEDTLTATGYLTDVSVALLKSNPAILRTLRMTTCPPLAVDRLVGLSGVSKTLVNAMEQKQRFPPRMPARQVDDALRKISRIIEKMADRDIFVWIAREDVPSELERYRAASIVADRLCGAVANPIIRNAQEKRQLAAIGSWLDARGYKPAQDGVSYDRMLPGTYSFRLDVSIQQQGSSRTLNIPIDTVVMPMVGSSGDLPLFLEAKSAGDFTNVNKRRKEEATKMGQLRHTYGDDVRFNLFLCGYFNSGYLGFEAAEGIDWVWEHRIDDLAEFGL